MQITDFSDFLAAARSEAEPQQLLFAFAVAELPQAHSPGQKQRFDSGRGGALAPVMCVDKPAAGLYDFDSLEQESRQTGQPWDMVFAAALSGHNGQAPAQAEIDRGQRMMVDAIHRGAIERFLAFDRQGKLVVFE